MQYSERVDSGSCKEFDESEVENPQWGNEQAREFPTRYVRIDGTTIFIQRTGKNIIMPQ